MVRSVRGELGLLGMLGQWGCDEFAFVELGRLSENVDSVLLEEFEL